jgi:leucyl aminopeptidase
MTGGPESSVTPIIIVSSEMLPAWLAVQDDATRTWVAQQGYTGAAGASLAIPSGDGSRRCILHGAATDGTLWTLAGLPTALPAGHYRLADDGPLPVSAAAATDYALGWRLGSYAFTRYKERKSAPATLEMPAIADAAEVARLGDAICLARDLINTPAEDMGPSDLAAAARDIAARHDASIDVIVGDELLVRNYPLVHAVGRASARPPQLVDFRWGAEDAPKVTLVGKGVCFDSGGLDIKPSAGMRLMKKDMGGAATVLGLADALMRLGLPIRLRVLIPAVENAISGTAFRPGDIFKSRKGLTVEIGNTDAEGRLILADALAEAASEKPDLLIDLATLTGAARAALGPELPALFTHDEKLAAELLADAFAQADPLWRLPLWKPYAKHVASKAADLNNAGADGGMAGAITAALFLESFVDPGIAWAHIDTYAWNAAARPGRPEGGEALALRALYHFIRRRFG